TRVEHVRDAEGARAHLGRLAHRLRARLTRDLPQPPSGRVAGLGHGPIVPLLVGGAGTAVAASERLAAAGWLVFAVRPPTVPEGTSRLRLTLHAALDETMVDAVGDAVVRTLGDQGGRVVSSGFQA